MVQQAVGQLVFAFFPRLPIVVELKDVQVSSDAGILPLREFDDQIGLTERFIGCLHAPRDQALIDHSIAEMVRQRVYGILAGYEDGNDHDTLRGDPIFKIVADRAPHDPDRARQPTLSRFENSIDVDSLFRMHDFFIDDFIRSFDQPPTRITLDLDATDDPCHGQQQLALFHGFYDQYPYLPLIISCAETDQILWAGLRFGTCPPALGADDDLTDIVTRLRQAWPDVEIHVRADTGFGVPAMYRACEALAVGYTFGLSTNPVLRRAAEPLLQQAVERFAATREPVRLFDHFLYQAGTWKNPRCVVVKAECNRLGTNVRLVVTNRPGAAVVPEACYDNYVERGESENRHKELENGLAGDRLSCHRFFANDFRLQLHAAALNLLVRLRRLVADPPALTAQDDPCPEAVPVADPSLPPEALTGRERRRYHTRRRQRDPLGRGHIETWRTMLIKVAGEVTQSVRRILITLPAHWPHLAWFRTVCERIAALRAGAQVPT